MQKDQHRNDMWDRYAGGKADWNPPPCMACAARSPETIEMVSQMLFPDTNGVGTSTRDGEIATSNVPGSGVDARVQGISLSG